MSVVEPTVPADVAMTTVPPDTVKLFPLASFNSTVTVDVETPFAPMVNGVAAIVELVPDAVPGTKATAADFVALAALIVNDSVALPVVDDDVNVAV